MRAEDWAAAAVQLTHHTKIHWIAAQPASHPGRAAGRTTMAMTGTTGVAAATSLLALPLFCHLHRCQRRFQLPLPAMPRMVVDYSRAPLGLHKQVVLQLGWAAVTLPHGKHISSVCQAGDASIVHILSSVT